LGVDLLYGSKIASPNFTCVTLRTTSHRAGHSGPAPKAVGNYDKPSMVTVVVNTGKVSSMQCMMIPWLNM